MSARANGATDRWGSRAELLWSLGAVGLGMAALFAVLAGLSGSGYARGLLGWVVRACTRRYRPPETSEEA